MFIHLGHVMINLDHVREIKQVEPSSSSGRPRISVTYSDGSDVSLGYSLESVFKDTRTVVQSRPDMILLEAYFDVETKQVSYLSSPVLGFYDNGCDIGCSPFTIDGEPGPDSRWVVSTSHGSCFTEGQSFSTVNAWKKWVEPKILSENRS